ncbi:MAG: hypothetical protein ACR2MN_14610 [Acidimicrobiales bacterium]
MSDQSAEGWLLQHHPEALADYPDPDQGRDHRQIELTETVGYWESDDLGRTGRRRPAGFRRAEALATHGAELAERERARTERIEAAPCAHCRAGTVRYPALGWCEPCYGYNARHGRLPGPPIVARRQRRLGSPSDISEG